MSSIWRFSGRALLNAETVSWDGVVSKTDVLDGLILSDGCEGRLLMMTFGGLAEARLEDDEVSLCSVLPGSYSKGDINFGVALLR